MSSALDQYRAWERTGPFVHILQIERGSASDRLTLTDRPYYDKGVAGSKYHDTYPAPIHCIVSDIRTTENMDGTSFDDVVLTNVSGRLDDILDYPTVLGRRFTILRGHPAWSLMEDSFPNTFLPIMRGQIDGALKQQNGAQITLQISPVRYKLDNIIGGVDTPVALGWCRNVPATLVDAATSKYRFNSLITDGSFFTLRDAGVPLTITTEYTQEAESSVFQGLVALVSPAAGDLTATALGFTSKPLPLINAVLEHFVVDDWNDYNSLYDFALNEIKHVFLSSDGAKLYILRNADPDLRQYTLGTPVSGSSYDSKSRSLSGTYFAGRLNAANTRLYLINWTGFALNIAVRTLSVAKDISTAALSASSTQNVGSLIPPPEREEVIDMLITQDESQIWLLSSTGSLYILAVPTPGTMASITLEQIVDLFPFVGYHGGDSDSPELVGFALSGDQRTLYILNSYREFFQLELPTADDASEMVVRPHKLVVGDHTLTPSAIEAPPAGGRILVLFGEEIWQYDIDGDQLPHRATQWACSHPATGQVISSAIGLFLPSETEAGQVISTLLQYIGAQFCVGRLGELWVSKLYDPAGGGVQAHPRGTASLAAADAIEHPEIWLKDCLGEGGRHVRQISWNRPVQRITASYDQNYSVQSASQLAGSVSVANVEYYGKPYLTAEELNTMPDYPEELSIFLETNMRDLSATPLGLERYLLAEMNLHSTERAEYEIDCTLSAIPGYADFGVGQVVAFPDGLGHPDFETEPYIGIYSTYSRVETPSTATNTLSGDFSGTIRMQIFTVPPVTPRQLYGQWTTSAGTYAWKLSLKDDGRLQLAIVGNSSSQLFVMTDPLTAFRFSEARPFWLRFSVDMDNGSSQTAVTWRLAYTRGLEEPADDDFSEIETLTAALTGALTYPDRPVILGAWQEPEPSSLRVMRAILRNGSTIVSDLDARLWASGYSFPGGVVDEVWSILATNSPQGVSAYTGAPRALVTGRQVNWSKQQQTLRVFK